MSLCVFSIKEKMVVGVTTVFLPAGGIYAMLTLPIDAVPDLTDNQAPVVTVSPALAPQEVRAVDYATGRNRQVE